VTGEVEALMAARVLRLHPGRRVATVSLRSVGPGRSYSGAYSGRTGEVAPVLGRYPWRSLGRVIKVDPTTTGGAELDLIIGDDDTWQSLAAGTAKVEALVAFEANSDGDPVGGRPVRVEIG
jgi:hypothetical protein